MSTQSRPVQDHKTVPRVRALLGCLFTFEEIGYEALIRDISLKGAFLWSKFMPPPAADLSIKVDASFPKTPLFLESRVVRSDRKSTGQGTVGVFAVKFR